jgi:hypothetical protein
MLALLIGFLVVVASAAVFGYALFGQRPLPQPATNTSEPMRRRTGVAETAPSAPRPRTPISTAPSTGGRAPARAGGRAPAGQATDDDSGRRNDVGIPLTRRLRSAALLGVSVLGAALLVGAVVSIIVVGAVLLVA